MYMLLNIHFLYKNGKSVLIYKDIAEPGNIREKYFFNILKAVIKERSITIKYAPNFFYAEILTNSVKFFKRKIGQTLMNTDQSQRRKQQ